MSAEGNLTKIIYNDEYNVLILLMEVPTEYIDTI